VYSCRSCFGSISTDPRDFRYACGIIVDLRRISLVCFGHTVRPTKDILLQTKVTPEQETVIRNAADAQGLSVAAYLRSAAMQSATAPLVHAWVTNYGEQPELWLARAHRPHYVLRQLRVGVAGEKTFAMFSLDNLDRLVAVPAGAVAFGMD